ncbi:glycosyltransferase family 4 protein [Neptuniibacter marinus]|uniref:glycosyltransferase family 4 protein n=1 Tax=Neptuniibacter marinus TaxID=1806670 RepID=UPI000836C3C0|nr:glycosyltransferase family 4 protein [Neptuniibacter marinus]
MSKNIIFVSGIQVYPPQSGGQLRSYNLCKALAKKGHNVSIYSFTGRKKGYLQGEKSFVNDVDDVPEYVNMSRIYGFLQFFSYRLGLPPLWLAFITRFYIPKKLKNLIKQSDMLIVDFPYLSNVFKISNGTNVLNTHNAEFELFSSSFISSVVRKLEIKAMKAADLTVFCCQNDMDKFCGFPAKACIVPNGLDLGCFDRSDIDSFAIRAELNIPKHKKIVLFTGSSYAPNKIGFEDLLGWCKLNTKFIQDNNLVFLVVGSVSEPYEYSDVFKALGRVDSVYKYLLSADLAINPVASGSGANVKVAEYIAAKLPVISTEFGVRGFELDSDNCFIFDFSNLKECLQLVLNENDLKGRSSRAYQDNLQSICMYSGVCKIDDL